MRIIRRIGIAIGSLVAAGLVMSLVGGVLLPFAGVPYQPWDPTGSTTGGMLVGLATLVLGGLIYRDIIRREGPPPA